MRSAVALVLLVALCACQAEQHPGASPVPPDPRGDACLAWDDIKVTIDALEGQAHYHGATLDRAQDPELVNIRMSDAANAVLHVMEGLRSDPETLDPSLDPGDLDIRDRDFIWAEGYCAAVFDR